MQAVKCIYLILIILSITLKSSLGKRKSADRYFDLCRRNDPNMNVCITKAIRKAIPLMIKGIPDIGFSPLDPFFIKTLRINEGGGNFRLSITVSNVTMKGLANMSFKKFSIDLKNESNIVAKLETSAPWIHFNGKYALDGELLLVPLRGKGNHYMNCTGTDLKGVLNFRTKTDPNSNRKYLYADSFQWDLSIKGGTVHFYNLFNGNKVLGDTVNRFLKTNFVELFTTIKHLPEQAFAALFKDVVNSVFTSFTYDELFLPG